MEKLHSDGRETLLPFIGYATYQSYLKALRLRAGIAFPFTTHMVRHTFGTMTLSAGIPIESIAKMMVHASISSTQVYAQVTDSKISEDMDRLIDKYNAKDKNTANADIEATIGTKTISFVINSNERKTEAHWLRKHICQELQNTAFVIIPIFLFGNTDN